MNADVGSLGEPTSLLARRLEQQLRPEFEVEVIVPAIGNLILGVPECRVSGCVRGVQVGGLCRGHYSRWRHDGKPAVDGWAAVVDPTTRGHRPLHACAMQGCRRGSMARGLCARHHDRWDRSGEPDAGEWLDGRVAEPDPDRPTCLVQRCALLVERPDPGLCISHQSRWRAYGRPPVDQFVFERANFGEAVFDLRGLPAQLRMEIAYGLQCRVDERRAKAPARALAPLLRLLEGSGVGSLLDRPVDDWLAEMLPIARWGTVPRSFVRFTIERIADLLEGAGWEAEFPRDVWLLRRLGYPPGGAARVRFDRISQLWLRELAKRWARLRLSCGLSTSQVTTDIAAVSRLSAFLDGTDSSMSGPASLDRDVIERYLAWLATERPSVHARGTDIGSVAGFLRGVHQHRWAPALPATAAIYDQDRPRRPELAPRALSEHVMAQMESPGNLARFRQPVYRLVTEILMGTGMRISDVCGLALDCLVRDPGGAAYLRYRNHKMRREAFVPIDEDLAAAISEQQIRVAHRHPSGTCLFPRPTRNPDGTHPLSRGTYVRHLNAWLKVCEVHDELGRPVHVTPHQWRHTYATRLVNADVPLEIVRRLLDHTSSEMTDHYARMHDRTVRDHWEKARKVNIHGEPIAFNPGSPLADAAWLKDRLARAKIALPNGYCTLPLQKRCEVANACLTCPMFATTTAFLPQHREQLEATRQLIARAEQHGQDRMVEMNRDVEANLLRIITSLDQHDEPAPDNNDDTQDDLRAG